MPILLPLDIIDSQVGRRRSTCTTKAKDALHAADIFVRIHTAPMSFGAWLVRSVKIFAEDERGQHRCVCSFLQPYRRGRMLPTPRHAAR